MRVTYRPSRYQRAILSLPEKYNLLLCGGRGGGKSFAIIFLLLKHIEQYGERARALLVRESWDALKQLEDEFELIALYATNGAVKHNKTEHAFYFPNGGTVVFNQIAEQKDYVKFQGKSFTLLIVDEFGLIRDTRWVLLLTSNLRGPKGIPLRTVWAANPGGPQHGFLYHEFIKKSQPWRKYEYEGQEWYICPSTWRDNPNIDQEDYVKKLRAACKGDEDLFRAWDRGDWDIARGAYFAGALDERIHKITNKEFPLQKLDRRVWRPYVSIDWGTGSPSVTYVFAESPGILKYPKGSLIICDELATHEPDNINEGLNWPPSKLAEATIQLAAKWNCPPEGVSDDANGLEETLINQLEDYGLFVVRPTKDRLSGWSAMREMLMAVKERNGNPGLFIHERCEYFWKTVPYLERDVKRPEDIVTKNVPDHGADSARYGVMHRYYKDAHSGGLVGAF